MLISQLKAEIFEMK